MPLRARARPPAGAESATAVPISIRGLSHRYRGDDGGLVVLDDLDLEIAAGEFVAVTGRSGAGKTTLLSILGGLERPQEGEVFVGDTDLARLSGNALAAHRRDTVGFVFQDFGLLGSLTALENIELALVFASVRGGRRTARAKELLAAVGLTDRARHRPAALSGGESQRVAIARRAGQPAALGSRRRADRQPRRRVLWARARHARGAPGRARVHARRRDAQRRRRVARRSRPQTRRRPTGAGMSYRDAIAIAARSVVRRLGRAVLTVLAVALAAALLSSLLIAGTAARSRVLDQVSQGGPLTGIRVDAATADPGALDSDNPPSGAPRPIDEAARKRIAALPGVRNAVAVVVNPVQVIPPEPLLQLATASTSSTSRRESYRRRRIGDPDPFRDQLVGIDLSHLSDVPVTVEAGRMPAATSLTEVVVTENFLRRFGLEKADAAKVLGTEVEIGSPRLFLDLGAPRGRWTRMSIVGVVAQQAGEGDLLAPLPVAVAARQWTASGADPAAFHIDTSPYSALFVVASSLDRVAAVRAEITAVGYTTSAPESLIDSVQRYVHVIEIVLGGIGLIGLVIAALGITNAMLAAVRERRREIGVLKAIGARDRDVRRIFLLEASTLGFVGGAIGTTAGWLTARALAGVVNGYLAKQGLQGVSLGVPTLVLAGGIVGATLLALVAGTVPAQRAARLPTREAMGDK